VRLAYARVGSGPPLVKAANWLTHLEHDLDNPLWRPFLERLARRRTLVRYDQRGCGLSDWRVSDMSFEAWVADLETVVDAAGLPCFALLGISQGGPVAVAYAARHPERVTHLVLYGAFARGALRRTQSTGQIEEARALAQLVRLGWGKRLPTLRHVFSLQFLPHASAAQLRMFDDLQRVSASAENAARILSAFELIDVTGFAPRVRTPTLVLHSNGDARIPFEEGRSLAALIPGARFVPIASSSHVPLQGDAAFDRLMEEIDGFLEGGREAEATAVFHSLTTRERDILGLLALGLTNEKIASRLGIGEKTVRNRMTGVFGKLRVTTRGEAIVKAREAGFGMGGASTAE
jgi:pimeloyl-ACP methyl ester carboxylesterase/DNA-binding CsgD family transcriptional regulator